MRGLLPFDGFFGDTALDHFFSDAPAAYKDYVSVPKVDIEDKKDFYEITCDMPGFTKDQISISYENGILSLSAQKEEQTEEKDDDRHYIRRERSSSVFRRQFNVKGIKEDGIKAGLKDGILTITLPKLPQEIEKAPVLQDVDDDFKKLNCYKGNMALKGANVKVPMTDDHIREFIK